ncbi:unnamed protein product [Adineta ricciae]|uniref:Uncharacterized protein n=1 Tax=Adineta ricciae TaxID=249248 RepID=A0A814NBW9_ADIRI|nr:unnamed protein product [Adineta ricciae]CAF1130578.1 unnamed protein product [Adineta ricciae]
MWIESGTLSYNVIEQDGNVAYIFGPPNMRVKYENLIQRVRNHTTGLTDTVTGRNSSWHEHFAVTATENYIELGHSFPELLRLAELAKLTAVALVFQHRYRELRKVVLPPSTETVAQILITSNLRGQVFNGRWPLATVARVEELLDKALIEQGINLAYKHRVRNLDESRALIRQQLTEVEHKQIKEIAQALQKAFNISENKISRSAISSYLGGVDSIAENALLQEIVSGIAERIRTSQHGAIRLYETMSQSRYSVGNAASVLPEFAQISLGKGPINDFDNAQASSCYYVPTQISLAYQGNGTFLQKRGGIKLQPRLQYQFDPISEFQHYRPLRPMVFRDPIPPSPTENILFNRVSVGKGAQIQYGAKYLGKTLLSDYNGWDRLLQQQRASADDKKIISSLSSNEGKLEAVQTYDSEVVSAGAMQKTIKDKGVGELPEQVWRFKQRHPQLYEDTFKAQGWEVKKKSNVYSMTYNQQTGNELKTSLRKDFQEKIKSAPSKPLEALVNAISGKEYQELQVVDFVDRLHKQVLPKQPVGYKSYTIGDYLQSNFGRAVALDHHINRPGYIALDFGKALTNLFTKYPDLSKNPDDWGENREKYETELIEYYGVNRRMHDPVNRFKKIKKYY